MNIERVRSFVPLEKPEKYVDDQRAKLDLYEANSSMAPTCLRRSIEEGELIKINSIRRTAA